MVFGCKLELEQVQSAVICALVRLLLADPQAVVAVERVV